MVKWVVSLDKLAISGFEDEPTTEPPRHTVVQSFIEQFAQDPVAACKYLVERSNPRVDAVTLASLIFKTPELDRTQIGMLLAGNDRLMRAFVDRFHFSGIRIDDALRMFLLAVRLPGDPTAGETLLRGFAHRYFEANRDIISYSRDIAEDLVLWIMQLNDSLYGMYGFALPNHAITLDLVISVWQSKDPHQLVHQSLLSDIYSSLKAARIDQALMSSQESKYGRQVEMVPSRLPSKMTYEEWSDEIVLRIPERDERFQIRLLGEGLEFQPELLDFGRGREQKFRVRGLSLGTKSILFDRAGANAYVGYSRMLDGADSQSGVRQRGQHADDYRGAGVHEEHIPGRVRVSYGRQTQVLLFRRRRVHATQMGDGVTEADQRNEKCARHGRQPSSSGCSTRGRGGLAASAPRCAHLARHKGRQGGSWYSRPNPAQWLGQSRSRWCERVNGGQQERSGRNGRRRR